MRKLILIATIILVTSTINFGQVYIQSWGLGFGFLYPRYIAADVIPTDFSYGGYLSLQHEFSEHVGVRLKGYYAELKSEKPEIISTLMGGGLDLIYSFVPCEPVSPYMGFGFNGFTAAVEKATKVKNKTYYAYQFNLLGGVNWSLGEGAKFKTEIGYHTVSEDQFDGVNGPSGGFLGGGQDAYMSFEVGFLIYLNLDEASKFCDIYKGIPKYTPTIVDYNRIERIVKQNSPKTEGIDYNRIEEIIRRYAEQKPTEETKKNWVLIGVNFESGKSTLTAEAYPILINAVSVLLLNPELNVEIHGHTDNVGGAELNRKLSIARAETVQRFLISKGVQPSRLSVTGFGDTQPLVDNNTPEGKAINRRIEFKVTE
ncbi:MAG TPA: OmpA family protein [Ignavibacteriaceae bacterium]|nr:OmpA family protein [Ignavibacteriaceae bacterium]HPO56359.1 OmpA family protein [Ignavibacteriaceae bacterium]